MATPPGSSGLACRGAAAGAARGPGAAWRRPDEDSDSGDGCSLLNYLLPL